jgi:peptidoglycan/xylan/chitin deacetylase (PgdA/CDA1 family)
MREVVEAGHEIGHHGYLHLEANAIDAKSQREEIERGIEALERTLNVRPRGYRSPSWELTPDTFALLIEHEFAYDSSCMGDDRPYVEACEDLRILELPVHWSLDDWPHLHWRVGRGDSFTAPDDFVATWLLEYESARADRRHLTLTMHPEVIGRGYRAILLERLIVEMRARGNPWFATHGDVERWLVG